MLCRLKRSGKKLRNTESCSLLDSVLHWYTAARADSIPRIPERKNEETLATKDSTKRKSGTGKSIRMLSAASGIRGKVCLNRYQGPGGQAFCYAINFGLGFWNCCSRGPNRTRPQPPTINADQQLDSFTYQIVQGEYSSSITLCSSVAE